SARRFPRGIQIEQDRDQLRLAIGVDFAVFLAALAANGERGRPAGEIHSEFLSEGGTHSRAHELLSQGVECGAVSQRFQRKTAPLRDFWVIALDLWQGLGLDEAGDNAVFE